VRIYTSLHSHWTRQGQEEISHQEGKQLLLEASPGSNSRANTGEESGCRLDKKTPALASRIDLNTGWIEEYDRPLK
jgi:hypothetical protein